ncbi:hypothetical protein SKAU_G00018240 [Synaphobranchus kaupii]|uniref:Uncharacterized protein n=1 Tax=Synaphobranchus kaupii TaxID=118154 RepID=A0A9Q1GBA2_SYNKA|nr:hypothetical protein SKAU_G00018240 [Synaphobranchus kaupii]
MLDCLFSRKPHPTHIGLAGQATKTKLGKAGALPKDCWHMEVHRSLGLLMLSSKRNVRARDDSSISVFLCRERGGSCCSIRSEGGAVSALEKATPGAQITRYQDTPSSFLPRPPTASVLLWQTRGETPNSCGAPLCSPLTQHGNPPILSAAGGGGGAGVWCQVTAGAEGKVGAGDEARTARKASHDDLADRQPPGHHGT